MYTVLGNDVIDSKELAEKISSETDFVFDLDITKSTKREDVVALRFSINTDDIYCDKNFNPEDDEIFEEYMEASEEMMNDYLDILCGMKRRFIAGSYKWDEVTDSIYIIVTISDISLSYMKLKDVFNRLLKQND